MSDQFQIDMKAVEAAVVSQIADDLIEQDRLRDLVRDEIDSRISKLFETRVEAEISSAIESAARDGFDREYQAVDSFGSKVGEPTTIRKRLDKMTSEYWSTPVDKYGKKSDGYGDKMSRAEWTMMKACGEDFAKQLSQEAVNVSAALKDGLRVEMRAWIDKSLGDLFNVRSKMDKHEGRRK